MDDEEAIRDLLSEILTTLGYEVVCTHDGMEATVAYQRAQAAGQPFTAVILDITVPGGVGGKERQWRVCRGLIPGKKPSFPVAMRTIRSCPTSHNTASVVWSPNRIP